MRFIVWIWVHRFYRLTKTALEHIPELGPALLVCNHASFVDALIIFAGSPRPVPVIPLALRGLWGSFFSRRAGTAMRFPRGILSRIELVGAPATAAALATPEHLQAVVAELRGEWR